MKRMDSIDPQALLSYFEKVRERTMRVVRCIPPDKLDWTCREGEFTLADLARHIATTERYVFAESLQGLPARYPGCGKELADGHENILDFMQRLHQESVVIFSGFSEQDWNSKRATPSGSPITAWKLLRAMIEHEIHHRGQIYVYLGILGVPAPALYGLRAQDLAGLVSRTTL